MHNRRHRAYRTNNPVLNFQFGKGRAHSPPKEISPRLDRQSSQNTHPKSFSSSHYTRIDEHGQSIARIGVSLHLLRRRMKIASSLVAALNLLATVLGYFALTAESEKRTMQSDCLKAVLCAISAAQVIAIVDYWRSLTHIREEQSLALQVQYVPVQSLLESPQELRKCILECGLHLLVPLPMVHFRESLVLFGHKATYTLSDLLYISIVLRNYHLFRVVYWFSEVSKLRTLMYARITTVRSNAGFILRCILTRYSMYLIITIYALLVLIAGLVQFTVEEGVIPPPLVADSFWSVGYTQTTIGYGDNLPTTFFGQFALMFSIFWGIALQGLITTITSNGISLNFQEFHMCSELMTKKHMWEKELCIVELLQAWWRLVKMRMRRQPHAPTILCFYYNLRKFRAVLVHCNSIKAGLFESQVAAFEESVTARIRENNSYLYVITHVAKFACDIERAEYRVSMLARKLAKRVKRYKTLGDTLESTDQLSERCSSPSLIKTRAERAQRKEAKLFVRAKNSAMQNVKTRLVKSKSPVFIEKDL